MTEVVICIPAWGEQYRRVATQLTIPALVRALQRTCLSYQFIIYTDDRTEFEVLPNVHGVYREVPEADTSHDALTLIHTRTLNEAPHNAVVGLFNADTIPSEELIAFGAVVLSAGYLALAAFGLRTLWTKPELPVVPTQSAAELLNWGWKNRHPIVENCIWGRGKTAFPVTIFFVNGHSNVVAHCSHLHPFLIRKDRREYVFRGTIDDGLLQLFKNREVYYCGNRQVGFIELSTPGKDVPQHFTQVRNDPMDEDFVAEFGKNYLTSHCRSLREGFRIIGDGPVYTTPAVCIAERVKGNQ